MTDPLALMDTYLEVLDAAGIRSAVDGRDINPPAVQLRAPTLTYRFGRGCVEAAWTARLILPNNGQRTALAEALPLLQRIQDALEGAVVTATPTDFELPDGGGPVPGYTLTWTTH